MEKELPTGWVEAQISDLFYVNPGHKGLVIHDEMMVSFIPMPAIMEKTNTIIEHESRPYGKVNKGYTKFIEGDVLFAKITPCMENGKIAIAKGLVNEIGTGTTELHVFRTREIYDTKLLYYFLIQQEFRDLCKYNFSGAVGQQRISKSFLSSYSLMVPPKNEQLRIVEKLDSLFEKIDSIKARLSKIQNIKISEVEGLILKLESSILMKAFIGELVAQDPNDEPAWVLLEKVQNEEHQLESKAKMLG
jgi:type I restriction enzyme S subunit